MKSTLSVYALNPNGELVEKEVEIFGTFSYAAILPLVEPKVVEGLKPDLREIFAVLADRGIPAKLTTYMQGVGVTNCITPCPPY